jgi:GntR family transcriptional repressor for pyruvate dehydrogenase complex
MLAEELRGQILSGAWQSGESLPSESELITATGYSRATVREALRLLEAEGNIVTKRGPKGGITVTRPGVEHLAKALAMLITQDEIVLEKLFEFRKLVEPEAAKLAAVHATAEQRQALLTFADMNLGPPYRHDAEFHVLIAHATGNELLSVLLLAPFELLRLHLAGESVSQHDVEGSVHAHQEIARAISLGDGERAKRVMLKHLQSYEDLMRAHGRLAEPIIPRHRWAQIQDK